MNPTRFFLLLVAGCCLAGFQSLRADDAAPFATAKQYSSDMVMTTKDGTSMTSKIYADDGKVRTEMNTHGMEIVSIMRPDQKKMYTVMAAQKMVMEMPYDASKFKQLAPGAKPEGKFELVGPDTVDGVACTKYKVTSDKDGKVVFFWIDTVQKIPLKMTAEDGTFTILWKNYKLGPQDATLFEVPAGYQVMNMPSMPGGIPHGMPQGDGQ